MKRLSWVAVLAVAGVFGAPHADAASVSTLYDFDAALSEPHPLAPHFGTRFRPATNGVPAAPARPAGSPPGSSAGSPQGTAPKQAAPKQTQSTKPAKRENNFGGSARTRATARGRPVIAISKPKSKKTSNGAVGKTQKVASGGDGTASARKGKARERDNGFVRDPLFGFIEQLTIGGGAQDIGPFSNREEEGFSINFEARFTPPEFFKYIWLPQIIAGTSLSTAGDTSIVGYLGLQYEWDLWKGLFAGFSTGGSYNNGFDTTDDPDRKELGCSLLFRQSINLGYRITEKVSFEGYYSHNSNASICEENESLEIVGVRTGYRF